jgi:hypothetical protein
MGNKQSAPSATPNTLPTAPPPTPPVCDMNCQRQKQLDGLKLTLDQKEETQSTDPDGYQQARLAYYTAVNGQGWLSDEKNRIASDEVEPILTQYTDQFKALNGQLKTNTVFANLASSLQAEQESDEGDVRFLKKQLQKENDTVATMNRLTTLTNTPTPSNYLPILADLGIVLLALFVLYMIYSKFSTIKGYFGFGAQPSVPMGGKRLPQ